MDDSSRGRPSRAGLARHHRCDRLHALLAGLDGLSAAILSSDEELSRGNDRYRESVGVDSAHMTNTSRPARAPRSSGALSRLCGSRISFTIALLLGLATAQDAACYMPQRSAMSTSAQDYIDAFRRGEDFAPPAKNVFANGQPDESAVKLLGEALAKESPNVRENIVKLLVDMARQTDPLTAKGADVVRHRRIIEVLAGSGLAQADLGRDAAMEALRKLVTQPDLSRVGEQITMALDKAPTEDAFLLVAKAKPPAAKATVERLIALPRWQNVQAARVANAALGSTASEEPFLRAAADA